MQGFRSAKFLQIKRSTNKRKKRSESDELKHLLGALNPLTPIEGVLSTKEPSRVGNTAPWSSKLTFHQSLPPLVSIAEHQIQVYKHMVSNIYRYVIYIYIYIYLYVLIYKHITVAAAAGGRYIYIHIDI